MAQKPGTTPNAAVTASEVSDHWRLLLFEGVVLMLLGAIALLLPELAIVAVNLLLGWLLLGAGALGLATTLMARAALSPPTAQTAAATGMARPRPA